MNPRSIENLISQVIVRAQFYGFVGESRNFDQLDLLQISKGFADIYRFYSTELKTIYWGWFDVPIKFLTTEIMKSIVI